MLFYAAVVYLPLADVMSFYMAGPIYVAALSHLLLGETVGGGAGLRSSSASAAS